MARKATPAPLPTNSVRLLPGDHQDIQRIQVLMGYLRSQQQALEGELHRTLARYGIDILNEQWELHAEDGVLFRVPTPEQPQN